MSQTDTFIATLTQTPQDAGQLLGMLNSLNNEIGQVITVLGYPETINKDLGTLDDALTTTSEILEFVSVVPDVGEAAAALNEAISVLSPEVKEAHGVAGEIDSAVAPLRDGLQEVQQPLTDLINAVQKVQTTSQTFLTDFSAVATCINGLPNGTYKTQGQAYLDQFSGTAQPYVAGLNTALEDAAGALGSFYSALSDLEDVLSPLGTIDAQIDQVLNVLSPVTQALSEFQNLLEQNITLPIPVYPVTVSIYDVFKEYGEFVGWVTDQIQGAINDVLSALGVTLPTIPGLADLIGLQLPAIPGIPDLSGLLNGIMGDFNQLEGMIPTFNLACPPKSPNDEVPGGGTYQR
ncbi:MAG TPA: hypothetical protein VMS43_09230 [Allosphingosinicella sp.]|nr:hypothetical protein [Allosphingosinicella sp.]